MTGRDTCIVPRQGEGWTLEYLMRTMILVLMVALASACGGRATDVPARSPADGMSTREFEALMHRLADAWNRNDAARAADCFTTDALYSAPPDARIRRGRTALYEFFGGPAGRPRPMRMEWHHLLFDPVEQIGAGEYTFEYEIRTHGIVIVRVVNGRIANWREYEHESPLSWRDMVGDNVF